MVAAFFDKEQPSPINTLLAPWIASAIFRYHFMIM